MPPPGKNANGRSLGGRKRIQSSPQSHTNIYFAQARRGLDVHWRTRATRQEDEQLQLDLPREEQTLFGFLRRNFSDSKETGSRCDVVDPATFKFVAHQIMNEENIIQSRVPVNNAQVPTEDTSSDSLNPYQPEDLWIDLAKFMLQAPSNSSITTIPIRKPNKHEFFRTRPR